MRLQHASPAITPLLYKVTLLEVLVLLVTGAGLFFLPAWFGSIWPWPLSPFNTGFLGAIYLASLTAALFLILPVVQSPARLVVSMIFVFTAVVLFVSLIYIDRFDLNSPATWLWFLLYLALPINAAYHVWLYRRSPPAGSSPTPPLWSSLLLIEGVILGLYAMGLLVAPIPFSKFWPWPLDDFHSRMYSVAFLTPALGAFLLYKAAAPIELLTLGLAQAAGGVLSILGLIIVNASVGSVNWLRPGVWLWIAGFAGLLAVGLGLIWLARIKRLRLP